MRTTSVSYRHTKDINALSIIESIVAIPSNLMRNLQFTFYVILFDKNFSGSILFISGYTDLF